MTPNKAPHSTSLLLGLRPARHLSWTTATTRTATATIQRRAISRGPLVAVSPRQPQGVLPTCLSTTIRPQSHHRPTSASTLVSCTHLRTTAAPATEIDLEPPGSQGRRLLLCRRLPLHLADHRDHDDQHANTPASAVELCHQEDIVCRRARIRRPGGIPGFEIATSSQLP